MAKGNAIIGQSGGPTSVINASLAGVIAQVKKTNSIGRVLGMRWAIEGFMKGEVVDLSRETPATLKGLVGTPGSALGSCRHKVQQDEMPAILKMLRKHAIRYVFMVGGNDTMDTIHRVEKFCAENGYEVHGVGIPKTVDNDLYGTDHTPGYPSAARYTALAVLHAGILARDMQKVDQFVIYQSIGRDAGWLTAAAALAKTKDPASAPHILLLPEVVFDPGRFLAKVGAVYKRFGWVSIAAGEGVRYADGTPVSASETRDKFGNIELGAMGGTSVGLNVHKMISKEFDWRGEFQITESLPMSAADRAVKLDLSEAYRLGQQAVRLAAKGVTGRMVTLERAKGAKYAVKFGTAALQDVAVRAKPMPRSMITADGFFVTKKFFDYAAPLVGPMPKYVSLRNAPARPAKRK
ncbi:MAG: diphosphate--fructose-6-phosphate 1-phosphotransferase [Planctomycetota bacterium]|jgi:6-phosphofructokinase 1